jgi:Spy/CpxP family protein refolding chaperone
MNKTTIVTAVLVGISWMGGSRALAQEPASLPSKGGTSDRAVSGEDIKLFRKDVKSIRKQLIAANMDLTDAQAQQFWPVFDQYTAELAAIYDKKFALLKDYAQNSDALTDEQAESYIQGRAEVEQSIAQLRLKYFPIFRKVLSGKATAFFFQLDWRLALVVDVQLASETPVIEP